MPVKSILMAVLAVTLVTAPAHSTIVPQRTLAISLAPGGTAANGPSNRPSLSFDGLLLAFESTATNLTPDGNGRVADVFERDLVGSRTRLVSEGLDGQPANGASGNPAIGGRAIAFHSEASNLVPGDGNGLRDVFVRSGTNPIVRVSQPAGGGDANGPSGEPDISNDGRIVVFSSDASNLTPDDDNGATDVFVRDLVTGRITRLSEQADRDSRAPALSSNGRFVTFYSLSDTLVPGDTNGVGDVFLADLATGRLELVSIGRRRQQNRAVVPPFPQISDVSRDGRFVVFDSDATNLVRRDTNRDTDVFLRDRARRKTVRISVNRRGRQGDNDSFFPSMSSDGRYIVFQSFAERLAPGDGKREDIFIYDRVRKLPAVLSVGSRGQRRGDEHVDQLLQRPALSGDGQLVTFTSTADNLTNGDAKRLEDVFLRITAPPHLERIVSPRRVQWTRRPWLRVDVDDSRATVLVCTLDGRAIPCRNGRKLRRLAPGRHVLRVRAGGPGMLYERRSYVRRFTVKR